MTDWLHSHKFSYKKLIDCFPSNEPIEFAEGVHSTIATKRSYGWIVQVQTN